MRTKREQRQLITRARRADEDGLHELYLEVFGADFAGSVTVERARASIIEAVTERREEHVPDEKGNTATPAPAAEASIADLLGETTPPPAEQPATTEGEAAMKARNKKPTTRKSTAAKSKKAAAPRAPRKQKELTILLRDPDVKRSAGGKVLSITGKCTWKEGGKYVCDKTRKIHAADAFQVRYCDEHKLAARNLARKLARKE